MEALSDSHLQLIGLLEAALTKVLTSHPKHNGTSKLLLDPADPPLRRKDLHMDSMILMQAVTAALPTTAGVKASVGHQLVTEGRSLAADTLLYVQQHELLGENNSIISWLIWSFDSNLE